MHIILLMIHGLPSSTPHRSSLVHEAFRYECFHLRNDHMALRGFHVQMQSSLPVLHILQSLILEQQHHILPVQRNLPSFLQELLLVLPTQMPHVLAFLRYYNLKLHFLMPLLQLLLLHDQVLLCLMHHT